MLEAGAFGAIHLPCGLADQQAQHFACVASSTSGNWIAWLVASGLPKGERRRAYLMLSSMQKTAAPSERRLPDAVLVHEALRQRETMVEIAEQRVLRHPDIRQRQARVVRRHVERPHISSMTRPLARHRHEETRDARRRRPCRTCGRRPRNAWRGACR